MPPGWYGTLWPSTAAIGTHYSVTTTLPTMLALLSESSLPATYFIEAWNCAVYGETISSLAAAGHEVAFHAWQHEVWSALDAETEVANLRRSVDAARGVGVAYRGFRPPGGMITSRTLGLMKGCGMRYLSPAARACAVVQGVAVLPFQWESIDAYFYMEGTKALRVAKGDGEGVLGPEVLRRRLFDRIDEVVEQGGYLALLFHPFLQTTEERMQVMRDVVAHVKDKQDNHGVWVAKCDNVAEWVLQNEESFGTDPGWDQAEWKKK